MHALSGYGCSTLVIACVLSLSMAACEGGGSAAARDGAANASGRGGSSKMGGGSGQNGGGSAGPGRLSTASASVARRLSRSELANLVRDTLGDDRGAPAK